MIFKRPTHRTPVYNYAPFIKQELGHCGPATLAMALQAAGLKPDLDEVTNQTYTPDKGTLQIDLITAARRQGALAIPLSGYEALLKELEAGHTVIVFENLGIRWIPQWHYALVIGYDLESMTLTVHSGPKANVVILMKEFELSWKLTDYWGLVVLKPSELSASASEFEQAQAAAALELVGQIDNAKTAYISVLSKWPENLISMIGLGNIFYKQKNYQMSVQVLKNASELYPDSSQARHNLVTAQQAFLKQLNSP